MDGDILRLIGLIVVIGYIIYLASKAIKIQSNVLEGLVGSINGEAGSSEKYLSSLNEDVIKLQDTLLYSKYNEQYTSIITTLDEYLTLSMLEKSLNMNTSDNTKLLESCNALNTLYQSKVALEQLKTDMENL